MGAPIYFIPLVRQLANQSAEKKGKTMHEEIAAETAPFRLVPARPRDRVKEKRELEREKKTRDESGASILASVNLDRRGEEIEKEKKRGGEKKGKIPDHR